MLTRILLVIVVAALAGVYAQNIILRGERAVFQEEIQLLRDDLGACQGWYAPATCSPAGKLVCSW